MQPDHSINASDAALQGTHHVPDNKAWVINRLRAEKNYMTELSNVGEDLLVMIDGFASTGVEAPFVDELRNMAMYFAAPGRRATIDLKINAVRNGNATDVSKMTTSLDRLMTFPIIFSQHIERLATDLQPVLTQPEHHRAIEGFVSAMRPMIARVSTAKHQLQRAYHLNPPITEQQR